MIVFPLVFLGYKSAFAITPKQVEEMQLVIKNLKSATVKQYYMHEHMVGLAKKKDDEIRLLKEFIELMASYGRIVLYLLPPVVYMIGGLLGYF
jgi:hypothetical protein